MKVKSESEFAQSCLTLSDPMDCSLPGSSIHGIFQARELEWGAIAFSKLPHSCTHLTCYQSNTQDSPSQASTVHEPKISTYSSWI